MSNWLHDIRSYGARAEADASAAIAAALAAIEQAGGGVLLIPPGVWSCGPIRLCSRLCLRLEAGAVLRFVDDFERYPPVWTRWEGVECYGYQPLIYGRDLEELRIEGTGVIDGNGGAWWREIRRRRLEGLREPQLASDRALAELNPNYRSAGGGGGGRETQFLRPPNIQLFNCRNVQLAGFTTRHSPFWNVHLVYCKDVLVHGVRFQNPDDTPNGDGLDLDSCDGVRVADCSFDVGDDCLVLKSGCDADGRRVGVPCQNITVTGCTMLRGHGGVVLGSEGAAGIRNVVVSNCIFRGTDRGIRLKSRRGRGGVTENLQVDNLVMEDVCCPLVLNLRYVCGADPADQRLYGEPAQPVDETTPRLRHLMLRGITSRRTRGAAAVLLGLAESPISEIDLSDLVIEMDADCRDGGQPAMAAGYGSMTRAGLVLRFCQNLRLRNLRLLHVLGPVLDAAQLRDIELSGLRSSGCEGAAALKFRDTDGLVCRGCQLPDYSERLSDPASCGLLWLD